MTGNKLKIIACVSMLIDHVGLLFFPKIALFRWIGRLAMPLFAYFIGVGCLHTRSRARYFLRVFLLALFCQAVYTAEEFIVGSPEMIYLNTLFTFSMSMPICFTLSDAADALRRKDTAGFGKSAALCLLAVAFAVFVACFAGKVFGFPIYVDYGIEGVLLPAAVVLFRDRKRQLIVFTVGTLLFALALTLFSTGWYELFSLLALPLLFFYNGQRGDRRLKWGFYFFYPVHLGALYAVFYAVNVLFV